jgi:anthranilate phosphoribosyltransferase
VGDPSAAPRIAAVLQLLGAERALVVHGAGLDELPLDGTGVLYDVTPAKVTRHEVVASALGLGAAPLTALAGGTPTENAALVEAVFGGELGPRRDVVLLNAAAGLLAAGRVTELREGIALAESTIDSGWATQMLDRLRARKMEREAATPQPMEAARA